MLEWATYFGGEGVDRVRNIEVDDQLNLYLVGYTKSDSLAYQGYKNHRSGSNDAYMAKFDQHGKLKWATYYGGSESEYGLACKVDEHQNIYLAGQTLSDSLISTPGSHQYKYGGNGDGYLVKFCQDIHVSYNSLGCSSFQSPSGKYTWTKSGIYMDTVKRISGCDSIVTVHLKIVQNSSSTISKKFCKSFVSPSGRYTWKKNGGLLRHYSKRIGL